MSKVSSVKTKHNTFSHAKRVEKIEDRILAKKEISSVSMVGQFIYDFDAVGGKYDEKAYTPVGSTITFLDSNPDTILDSASGFVTAGFASGDVIIITGSAANDGKYTIDTVVAGTITLVVGDALTTDAVGDNPTIHVPMRYTMYGTSIPFNAVITKAWAIAQTAPVGVGASLSIAIKAAADLISSEAIATFAVDTPVALIPVDTAGTMILCDDAGLDSRKVQISIEDADLTAGKIYVYVEYMIVKK